jgi:hypothetical protein
MLADKTLSEAAIKEEINLGHFRPSLIKDIKYRHLIPSWLQNAWDKKNAAFDRLSGYVPHKAVYEAKRERQRVIKEYEAQLKSSADANASSPSEAAR